MNKLKLFLSIVKTNKVYKSYLEFLKIKGNEAIFQLGSNTGCLSRQIAKELTNGGYLTCGDVSVDLVDSLKSMLNKYKNVNFCFGDIRKMNISCEIYDKIIFNECLETLPKADRESYLCFLLRLLKPKADIYVRQPISSNEGISSTKIRQIMREIGLKEVAYKLDKVGKQTLYSGTFKRN